MFCAVVQSCFIDNSKSVGNIKPLFTDGVKLIGKTLPTVQLRRNSRTFFDRHSSISANLSFLFFFLYTIGNGTILFIVTYFLEIAKLNLYLIFLRTPRLLLININHILLLINRRNV